MEMLFSAFFLFFNLIEVSVEQAGIDSPALVVLMLHRGGAQGVGHAVRIDFFIDSHRMKSN